MDLNFDWINLLILFGAVQGLLFGIFLLFNRRHPGARYLAVFVFVLAYNGFETFNWSAQLDKYILFFDLFPFIVIFALGPALYLYVNSVLFPERKLQGKTVLWFFAPFAFQAFVRVLLVGYVFLILFNVVDERVGANWLLDWYARYSEPFSIIVFLGFLIASVISHRKYRRTLGNRPREAQRIAGRWIGALLFFMVILGVAWPMTVIVPAFLDVDGGAYYYPIELGLVLFIYWIAMTGYHRTRVIFNNNRKPASVKGAAVNVARLLKLMEDESPYLDPELTVVKLSAAVGLSPKELSALINQQLNTSFNDFVNRYRVDEVCRRLNDPDYRHLTITGLALECGFNSQATFQRAFKSHTGVSPRNYVGHPLRKAEQPKNTSQFTI